MYPGVSGYNLQKNIVFFVWIYFFTFTNSVDPDEMQHYAAFQLGLHCLQKYWFRGFPNTKPERFNPFLVISNFLSTFSSAYVIW